MPCLQNRKESGQIKHSVAKIAARALSKQSKTGQSTWIWKSTKQRTKTSPKWSWIKKSVQVLHLSVQDWVGKSSQNVDRLKSPVGTVAFSQATVSHLITLLWSCERVLPGFTCETAAMPCVAFEQQRHQGTPKVTRLLPASAKLIALSVLGRCCKGLSHVALHSKFLMLQSSPPTPSTVSYLLGKLGPQKASANTTAICSRPIQSFSGF